MKCSLRHLLRHRLSIGCATWYALVVRRQTRLRQLRLGAQYFVDRELGSGFHSWYAAHVRPTHGIISTKASRHALGHVVSRAWVKWEGSAVARARHMELLRISVNYLWKHQVRKAYSWLADRAGVSRVGRGMVWQRHKALLAASASGGNGG